MKICPKCQKTYNDEALNFCLDDGAVLSQIADMPKSDDSLPETVMISPPRNTAPNQEFGGQSPPAWGQEQPSAQSPWGTQQQSQPSWGTNIGGPGQTPPPKSKSWIWVLGILAVVVVVCGGGFVGLMVLIANVDTGNKSGNNNLKISNNPPNSTSAEKFDKVDLSKWTSTNPEFAVSEYRNGEYFMGTKQKGFYYVLVTTANYKTENAITRLSLRNPDNKPSRLGYGLVFHSNPKPLTQDYALLIDTEQKRYRVVTHTPGKEDEVVKWKSSSAIKGGTAKNVLEVRDKSGNFELYINGEKVESLKNSDGYSGGVPGVYSGDGVQIAFSDLEIGK